MLERDGLVQGLAAGAAGGHVAIALTSLGAARQQAGAERLAAASRQLAGALDGVDSVALERALSALR